MPHRLRALCAFVAALCALLAAPTLASATTNPRTVDLLYGTLSYQGTDAANHVTLTDDGEQLTLRDTSEVLIAGTGCQPGADTHEVSCATQNTSYAGYSINTGDGADTVTIDDQTASGSGYYGGYSSLYGTVDAGAGNDEINGGASADTLIGGSGTDVLNGGGGSFDTVSYADHIGNVTATIGGTGGEPLENDQIGSDVENLIGGPGDDTLTGSPAANRLTGGGGADTLHGGAGSDDLEGANGYGYSFDSADGADTFDGGPGNDFFQGGPGSDAFDGGAGRDTVSYQDHSYGTCNPDCTGQAVVATLDGVGGSDQDGVPRDTLANVEGLVGTTLADTLTGNGANNTIDGNDGNDTIDGLAGSDDVTGGLGNDTIQGGAGDDTFNAGPSYAPAGDGTDTVDLGPGTDRANYSQTTVAMTIDLTAGTAVATGGATDSLAGVENATGGPRNDSITGTDGDNDLNGGPDNGVDTIDGKGGNDRLHGGMGWGSSGPGDGADVVHGGSGSDTLFMRDQAVDATVDCGTDGGDIAYIDEAGTYTTVADPTPTGCEFVNPPKPETASGDAAASQTITTLDNGETEARPSDPVETTLTTEATAGTLSISEQTGSFGPSSSSTATLGQSVTTSAPSGSPAHLEFILDSSVVPSSGAVTLVRYGSPVTDCPTNAYTPCVASRTTLTGGDLKIVVDDPSPSGNENWSFQIPAAGRVSFNSNSAKLSYTAAAGQNNDVSVTVRSDTALVRDTAATPDAGDNCQVTPGDAHEIKCSLTSSSFGSSDARVETDISTGDGDDTISVDVQRSPNSGVYYYGGGDYSEVTGILDGGAGTDTIHGGAGNEVLLGGAGQDVLDGGDGTDTVSYADHVDGVTVDLAAGTGGNSDDGTHDSLESVENAMGSPADDTISGTNGDNVLNGGLGSDTVNGLGGQDSVNGEGYITSLSYYFNSDPAAGGNDTLNGGGGDDQLTGGGGADTFNGGSGRDTASYSDHTSTNPCPPCTTVPAEGVTADIGGAIGGDGSSIDASGPSSSVRDTVAADVENLTGGAGDDTLAGSGDSNQIDGGTGNDTIHGGGGNDSLTGSQGDDQLFGDAGNDRYLSYGVYSGASTQIADGADTFDGGADTDRADYSYRTQALTLTLNAGTANDGATGEHDDLVNVENATGGSAGDSITGDAQPNRLNGGPGSGADTINGGDGNDRIAGGLGWAYPGPGDGADTLNGGAGQDEVDARDQAHDTVDCGSDVDVAYLDVANEFSTATDMPATGCENVNPESVTQNVAPGDVVATTPPASATDDDPQTAAQPVGTAVTAPADGTVSIQNSVVTMTPPAGETFLGVQMNITAPTGTVDNPLKLSFTIDSSLVPAGGLSNIKVYRNGSVIDAPCVNATQANPDPCILGSETAILPSGDAKITILSVHASTWNFGYTPAPQQPTDNGSGSGSAGGTGGTTTQPVPAPAKDTTAPKATFKAPAKLKLKALLKSGIAFPLTCSEACTVKASLGVDAKTAKKLKLPKLLGTGTYAKGKLTVKLSKAAAGKLKKARTVVLRLHLVVTDAAGNVAVIPDRKITVKR